MPKPKSDPEEPAIDVERDKTILPAEPIDTDDNDDPDADASGDSDDERPDENAAVRPTRE
jgi:hypothetical protein